MAERLFTFSYISFALSAVFLILAVFFCIKFRVIRIIGDLSGITAKRSIAKMRENNEKTGVKIHRASSINIDRGKITDKIKESEDFANIGSMQNESRLETGLLAENISDNQMDITTELLDNSDTCFLNENVGQALDSDATGALSENQGPLSANESNSNGFMIVDEIMILHTDEVI